LEGIRRNKFIMPRALMSVSDKTGLADLAQGLAALGWDLVASGGTAQTLSAKGISVVPVERLTRAPQMLGGRVKTLHPAIHAGILARDTEGDFAELQAQGFAPIDLVVCNLYPFQTVIQRPDTSFETAIENIDIGGVALLRAAAKNFQRVAVAVNPADYPQILEEIRAQGRVSAETRLRLATAAFAHTRDYDTAIQAYLVGKTQPSPQLGDHFATALYRQGELRYGENPHQAAGFYANVGIDQPLGAELLAGKALSYNNILDADAAWRAVEAFTDPAVVIVKHLNPCGIAVDTSIEAAYPAALASDPLSAFGGVIAVNRRVTPQWVEALGSLFIEVILAPDFDPQAQEKLIAGRKNCRLIRMQKAPQPTLLELRSVLGGMLIQERDLGDPSGTSWEVVTQRPPTPAETEALKFAWIAVQHVKSNAIVLAKGRATVGVGGGLSSRVDAAKLAVEKAGPNAQGAVLASDAFFPFPDAIEAAVKAGVSAVIQPGGALRDQQVIEAANAANVAMIFTGVRHFRH
jgi:phosphoribosylaminoimidazolecarboxamide formyltransferase/IMP cyclohydrolase